jgi:hypothetical protein
LPDLGVGQLEGQPQRVAAHRLPSVTVLLRTARSRRYD